MMLFMASAMFEPVSAPWGFVTDATWYPRRFPWRQVVVRGIAARVGYKGGDTFLS